MQRTLFLIPLALSMACTPKNDATSVYNRWRADWSAKNGTAIHEALSKRWRTISDAAKWKAAASDQNRKVVAIPQKDITIEWSATVTAELAPLKLKKTKEGWRMVGVSFPKYSRATPREAVTSFIFALRFQRLDVLSTLLTEEFRITLSKKELAARFDLKKPQVKALLDNLEKAKDNPILVKDRNALFPYSDSKSLKLVQEEDGWCIVDPD